jgi:hypothetical protein
VANEGPKKDFSGAKSSKGQNRTGSECGERPFVFIPNSASVIRFQLPLRPHSEADQAPNERIVPHRNPAFCLRGELA